jgi:mannose-6-phosphate isomerase-like protein (cupin superfamily)
LEYLRRVDFAQLTAVDDRVTQRLLDWDSGATSSSVHCIKTPPGEGSPAGMHTHVVDQLFYILSGTMSLEIDGRPYTADPGTLVVFPAGVPHRNWNAGAEATVHLAFNTPLPSPDETFARPVEVRG